MKTFSEQISEIYDRIGMGPATKRIQALRFDSKASEVVMTTASAVLKLHQELFPEQYNPSH